MQSYSQWVYGKSSRNFVEGRHFLYFVYFNGKNEQSIIEVLKKANVGKVEIMQANNIKRNDACMFRVTNGQRFDMIYVEKDSWIGVKPYHIFVFQDTYIKNNYKIVGTDLVPITRMGNMEVPLKED